MSGQSPNGLGGKTGAEAKYARTYQIESNTTWNKNKCSAEAEDKSNDRTDKCGRGTTEQQHAKGTLAQDRVELLKGIGFVRKPNLGRGTAPGGLYDSRNVLFYKFQP